MRPLVAVACVLLLTASTSLATTYTVRPDGTGDFPTIQAAIDACVNGDVVELTDGTFTGAGNQEMSYLGKAIVVRSQSGNPEGCIIDLQGEPGFRFASGEGPSSVLEGITFTNGEYTILEGSPTITGCIFHENNEGMVVGCEAPTISNCVFSDNNHSCFWVCMGTVWVNGGTISNCTFVRNSYNYSGGIYIGGGEVAISNCVFADGEQGLFGSTSIVVNSGSASIHNCTFVRNDGRSSRNHGRASGIDVHANASAVVDNCVLAFGLGLDYPAIYCEGTITLTCCDIYGNEGGDWVGCIENQYGINGNISEDPLFCDMTVDDFTLDAASPCAPSNSGSCGLIGALPVGCGATTVEPTTWGSIKQSFK